MLNTISSIGTFAVGASTLFFVYNVLKSCRYGAMVSVDDPWGFGNSLEWATTCPQEFHQELHHEKRSPESPSAAGAHGAREATDYQPAPQSGARPVEVPEPEQIRRPSFEHTDAPDEDGNPLDSDRGAPTDERWRHPHSRGENEER